VGVHPYEGVAFNLEERSRIQAALADNMALILRHHGLLSVGPTVADAFCIMYYLNKACEIQLAAAQLASIAGPVTRIPPALSAHVRKQFRGVEHERQLVWAAWLRDLDRSEPDYRL
jgi:ribulose-5-phosphate 4-epimerase/fuculose-1-phosphate aldolase